MGVYKDYCNKDKDCLNCSSPFWVKSAQRYCYDHILGLPRDQKQMRYKDSGRTHIVATGIIGHLHQYEGDDESEYERNFIVDFYPEKKDEYMYDWNLMVIDFCFMIIVMYDVKKRRKL